MARARWPWGIAALLILGLPGIPARALQETCQTKFRVEEGTRIVVPVRINERGPYQFLLDTGAAVTMIDEAVARRIPLKPMATISLTTITGVVRIPLAPVESLSLGDGIVNQMKVVFCDLSNIYSFNAGIHGVLAQDFLSNFNFLINRKEKTIRFEKGGELQSALVGRRIPAERRQSKSYLVVASEGVAAEPLRFLLDSGSPYIVVYSKATVADRLDIISYEQNMLLAETSLGSRKLRPCRVSGLSIGGLAKENLRVLLAELFPDEVQFGDGVLPLSMFDAVYFNNADSYVILNPVLPR